MGWRWGKLGEGKTSEEMVNKARGAEGVDRSWGYTLRTKAKGIIDGLDVDNERKQRAEKDAF